MEDQQSNRESGMSGRLRPWITRALLLSALWLVLSGHYDVAHIGFGLLSVALVLWLGRSPSPEREPIKSASNLRYFRLLHYLPWLGWEMIKSAIEVGVVVLAPRMPLSPSVFSFHSPQPNVLAKVILGNSVTLTPGTLTIDISGDEFTVHALTERTRETLLQGTMPRKVARLFQDEPPDPISDVKLIFPRFRI